MSTTITPKCTVRGHQHDLQLHETKIQDGTGNKGFIWECPTGYYRWFQTEEHNKAGKPVSPYTRMKQPHWGWKD